MSQTKQGSVAEVAANLAVGYVVNFIGNLVVLPLFGFKSLTLWKNIQIGLVFTAISVVRQYVLRRWFNNLLFGNKP